MVVMGVARAVAAQRSAAAQLSYFIAMDVDTLEENFNFTLSEDINGPLLAAVIGIEMVAGLLTNSFVLILTLCYLKAWKQPSNIFLTNMLLCNLFTAIFVMPLNIISLASGGWIFGVTVKQKVITCNYAAYMYWNSVLLITLSLMLLSFDRFFYIVHALRYRQHMTSIKAVVVVAISWVVAALLNMTPFFGFGDFRFIESYAGCSPIWEREMGFVIYTLIIFVLIIGSIIVTSLWTFCYMHSFLRKRKDRAVNIVTLSTRKNSLEVYTSARRRLIGLFGILMFIHVVCYLPGIMAAVTVLFIDLPKEVYASSYVLFLCIMTLSPLGQSYFRGDVRKSIATMLPCKKQEPKTIDQASKISSSWNTT